MFAVAIIIAVSALTLFSAWLSYCWRDSPWALPLMPLTSASLGFCWILLARWLDNDKHILVSSVGWDVFCVAVYALFPVVFLFHDRMPWSFWLGLTMCLIGLILMQWK